MSLGAHAEPTQTLTPCTQRPHAHMEPMHTRNPCKRCAQRLTSRNSPSWMSLIVPCPCCTFLARLSCSSCGDSQQQWLCSLARQDVQKQPWVLNISSPLPCCARCQHAARIRAACMQPCMTSIHTCMHMHVLRTRQLDDPVSCSFCNSSPSSISSGHSLIHTWMHACKADPPAAA